LLLKEKKAGRKPAWSYLFEDLNFVLNEKKGFVYQFAPGSVQYDKNFLEVYHSIVDQTQEDRIFSLMVQLLKTVFTRIKQYDDNKIGLIVPQIKEDRN
jgi:hypothetical protein